MGKDQVLVDPGLGLIRQFIRVNLARGEHHLAQLTVDGVLVDVHFVEAVVEANFLELAVCAQQRPVIPQADVAENVAVGFEVLRGDGSCCRVRLFCDLV